MRPPPYEQQKEGHYSAGAVERDNKDLEQPVHRPVAGVDVDSVEPRYGDALGGPRGGRQLRQRLERPVGGQCEDHALDPGAEPAPDEQLGQQRVDPEPPPQLVEHPGVAHRPGVDEAQFLGGGRLGGSLS